jgi:hypothetical protein
LAITGLTGNAFLHIVSLVYHYYYLASFHTWLENLMLITHFRAFHGQFYNICVSHYWQFKN